jgi:UDP-GlcNAc:undecaprenyl-phosphate/decaprenyl-phosphate GlcNAc-1-phosphate transferase
MIGLCLSLIGVAFVVGWPAAALLIRLSLRRGWVDHPDPPPDLPPAAAVALGRKQHGRPVPNTGGMALFLGVVLPLLAGLIAANFLTEASFAPGHLLAPLQAVAVQLPGLRQQTPMALVILAGAALIHVLGAIDDRRPLGPLVKLAVELVVAAALALWADLRALQVLDHYGPAGTALSFASSVLWIVTVTNAMNFLDNMDGLSAGVGAIIAGLYLAAALLNGQWFVAAAAALLLGALLAFLVFNYPPARLFLGDGGSLLLGFLLAVIAIRTTYFHAPGEHLPGPANAAGAAGAVSVDGRAWYGVLTPLVIMAVPLYDLTAVTLLRLWRGKNPFVADRNHFSHRLVRMGLTPRGAVSVIWLAALATGLGGVMLSRLAAWQAVLVAVQTLAVLALLALLEWAGSRRGG